MRDLAAVDSDNALRSAFAYFPSGVVAVCAEIDGTPAGLAVSTFVPVSRDPPLVSICVQNTSTTWPSLSNASHFGLSLLGTGQQEAAHALAARTGDRFRDLEVRRGSGSAVFVDGASAWIECTLETQIPAGDHSVVLLRIHRVATGDGVEPLVFHGSRFRRLD